MSPGQQQVEEWWGQATWPGDGVRPLQCTGQGTGHCSVKYGLLQPLQCTQATAVHNRTQASAM